MQETGCFYQDIKASHCCIKSGLLYRPRPSVLKDPIGLQQHFKLLFSFPAVLIPVILDECSVEKSKLLRSFVVEHVLLCNKTSSITACFSS